MQGVITAIEEPPRQNDPKETEIGKAIPDLPEDDAEGQGCAGQRNKRIWRRVSEQSRLQLEFAVSLGLPCDFVGKVIEMSSRNANRIMRELKERKEQKKNELMILSPLIRQHYLEQREEELKKAKLEVLMAIMKAQDAGRITKRNILKMDKKIN